MNSEHTLRLNKENLQSLYQYAMVLSQQPANAQDLLQTAVEIYLLEVKRGKTFHNHLAYIRTIIRNRFIDQYRSQQRWQSESYEEQTQHDISPLDLEQLHINQQELQQVWQTLEPQDRDILYHWAVLGHTTDEACEILQVPRGTFLSRIHRLRKRSAALFNQDDIQGGKG